VAFQPARLIHGVRKINSSTIAFPCPAASRASLPDDQSGLAHLARLPQNGRAWQVGCRSFQRAASTLCESCAVCWSVDMSSSANLIRRLRAAGGMNFVSALRRQLSGNEALHPYSEGRREWSRFAGPNGSPYMRENRRDITVESDLLFRSSFASGMGAERLSKPGITRKEKTGSAPELVPSASFEVEMNSQHPSAPAGRGSHPLLAASLASSIHASSAARRALPTSR